MTGALALVLEKRLAAFNSPRTLSRVNSAEGRKPDRASGLLARPRGAPAAKRRYGA